MHHGAQVWTQNEPEDARYWFPSFDFPSDKATSEEYITAKNDETVIANGDLLDTKSNADGTKTEIPIAVGIQQINNRLVAQRWRQRAQRVPRFELGRHLLDRCFRRLL